MENLFRRFDYFDSVQDWNVGEEGYNITYEDVVRLELDPFYFL